MSFILDALRKSEQHRQRAASPTLLTAQTNPPAPAQPGFSVNGWLAALLIGAGILIGWLGPWQAEPPPARDRLAPLSPTTDAVIPTENSTAMPGLLPKTSDPIQPANQVAYPVLSGKPQAEAPRQTSEEANMQQALPTPVPAEAEREKNVMTLNELPTSIRQEIPDIAISFHVYAAKPVERRVMINNELLRQGESIPPGLAVEQITPDGVVIGYKGYRFRHAVR